MTRLAPYKAPAAAIALIAAAACATAACGREGSLERPGPMFGLPRTDAAPAATRNTTTGAMSSSPSASIATPFQLAALDLQDAQASEQAARNTTGEGVPGRKREDNPTTSGQRDGVHSNDPPRDDDPVTKRDIQDPAQRLTPLSASPIPGVPNPLGQPISTQPPG